MVFLINTFEVEEGLRQGDPIYTFMYFIMVEGLDGMMYEVVVSGYFSGLRVNRMLEFNIIKSADDKIIVGSGSWNNL